jgi:Acetyltransferase (GNAT) family
MWRNLRRRLTKRLQQTFWVYVTYNFVVDRVSDFRLVGATPGRKLTPITFENCHRVREFRRDVFVSEYLEKLNRSEIGFFAEVDGKMLGSIWATMNSSHSACVVRTYVKLMANEALIYDIVTGQKSRGRGIAPFMLSRVLFSLFNDYTPSKIIIDVNVRNASSLRVMDKLGLDASQKVLCVSAFGKLKLLKVLREYAGVTDRGTTRLAHPSENQVSRLAGRFNAETEDHPNA